MNEEAEEDDAEEQDEEEEPEHKDEDKDSTHAIFIADVYETKTAADQPGRMRGRTRRPLESGRYQPKEEADEGEDEDTMPGKQPGSRIPA